MIYNSLILKHGLKNEQQINVALDFEMQQVRITVSGWDGVVYYVQRE